jgi:molecular chaperone GrpE
VLDEILEGVESGETGAPSEDGAADDEPEAGVAEEPAVEPVKELKARVADLQAQVEEIRQESNQNRERWLRAMAELENTRKRAKRELETSLNLANANLLRELLAVADNFERALASVGEIEDPAAKSLQEGVRLIFGQFADVLEQSGLSRIEAKGQPFDPNLHEAVSQIETDEVPSHHVVEVVQEGYLLRDMVLRPSRVVVAA